MRRLLVALGLVGGLLSPAFAADYDLPILRGSQPVAPIAPVTTVGPATFTRWSGFYVGGDFSYGNATTDFSDSAAPLVALSLRGLELVQQPPQSQVLGKGADSAFGGGGFLGYNTQWQDLSRRSPTVGLKFANKSNVGCVRTLCTRTREQNG